MSKNKIKIIAGICIVFLLGVLVGSVGTGLYAAHKISKFAKGEVPVRRAMVMKKLSAKLDLTPQQRPEVEKIVDQAMTELREFRQKHRPEAEKIFDHHFALIREKLDEEQKQKLDRLREKFKKRREN
jgi:hypothetical protein